MTAEKAGLVLSDKTGFDFAVDGPAGVALSKRQAIGLLAGVTVSSAAGTKVHAQCSDAAVQPELSLRLFRDVATGLASVAPNDTFAVDGAPAAYAIIYQKVGARAEERARYATAAAFSQEVGVALLHYRAPFANAAVRSLFDKLQDIPLNVLDFGLVAGGDGGSNRTAFNHAIAAANRSRKPLYLPAGVYPTAGSLDPLTGPGLYGDAAGGSIIQHLTRDSCIVARGSYLHLADLTVVNKSTPGKGQADMACFHLINCAYGRFTGLYAAHDLDDYAGILLEQRYDGAAEDAALLAHLGCWYNHFSGCTTNYASLDETRGYGIFFRTAASAREVRNPAGQAAGIYSGQCSYNIIDLANVEQRREGLRLEGGVCNQVRGGQFLGCDLQVVLADSSANHFIGTRHNQWRRMAFVERGNSDRNVILYPSLFQTTPQPWSLGRLSRNSVVVRSDQRGSWTPRLSFGGTPASTIRASGSFANVGGVVEVNWDIRLARPPVGGAMEIDGLPFPAINDPAEGLAICDLFVLSPGHGAQVPAGRIGHGYCATNTMTAFADHERNLTGASFGEGAILLGKMTYFTRWT